MLNIDSLIEIKIYLDGKWVVARPVKDNRIFARIKDALLVLFGKAEAIGFYKQ